MERIVIEVDDTTAEALKKISPEIRSRLGETVVIALKKIINDASAATHKSFLDAIGEEAQKKGLTEDILNDLLKADD